MSKLTLIATPLQDDLPLEPIALGILQEHALRDDVILLVEEHKVARQRWLKWGLPREAIERFVLFNEHTQDSLIPEIVKSLKNQKPVFLMSDCGLPAFCDPGTALVDQCHKQGILVTATPFPNSIALAVALSGFSHQSFVFSGFVPVKEPERTEWMKRELKRPETMIWMETPYRLGKLLDDLGKIEQKRQCFLGMDLGGSHELLLRGNVKQLQSKLDPKEKREFVLVVSNT